MDSIFYSYDLFTENIQEKGVNKAIVFKYSVNKHSYEDETLGFPAIIVNLIAAFKIMSLIQSKPHYDNKTH